MKHFYRFYSMTVTFVAVITCSLFITGCGSDNSDFYDFRVSPEPVYVDGTNGTTGATGTAKDPLQSIQAAITLAATEGRDVYVAEGLYLVDSSAGGSITMAPGVNLYGGYKNAAGIWTRDIVTHITTIRDEATVGGTYDDPRRAVTCDFGPQTGDAPVFDGFKVEGGGGDLSAGIFIGEDTSVVISHCVIEVGNATKGFGIKNYSTNRSSEALVTITDCSISGGSGDQVTGIEVSNSNLTVRNTTITLLTAVITSTGIDCGYGDVHIEGCTINGGTATITTRALYLNEAYRSTVTGCDINGGSGGNASYGIQAMDTEDVSDITANTIDGGTGTLSVALELGWVEVNPSVDDNLLLASGGTDRFGIYETGNVADPVSLTGNTFSASLLAGTGTSVFYHDVTNNIVTNIINIDAINSLDEDGLNPAGSVSGNQAGI